MRTQNNQETQTNSGRSIVREAAEGIASGLTGGDSLKNKLASTALDITNNFVNTFINITGDAISKDIEQKYQENIFKQQKEMDIHQVDMAKKKSSSEIETQKQKMEIKKNDYATENKNINERLNLEEKYMKQEVERLKKFQDIAYSSQIKGENSNNRSGMIFLILGIAVFCSYLNDYSRDSKQFYLSIIFFLVSVYFFNKSAQCIPSSTGIPRFQYAKQTLLASPKIEITENIEQNPEDRLALTSSNA